MKNFKRSLSLSLSAVYTVEDADLWKIIPKSYLFLPLSPFRWTARQRNVLHSSECMRKKLLPWHRSGQSSSQLHLFLKFSRTGDIQKCSVEYKGHVEPKAALIDLSLKKGFFFLSAQAAQVHIFNSATALLLWKVNREGVWPSTSNCSVSISDENLLEKKIPECFVMSCHLSLLLSLPDGLSAVTDKPNTFCYNRGK